MTRKTWLRAGIVLLILLDGTIGVWQYFFPRSFFDDFPTVRLDPPFNEHLVSDIGGLNIALVAVLIFAAVHLERHLVLAALTGFAVYSVTHFAFHFSHHGGLLVDTGLGFEAALTIALLALTPHSLPTKVEG